MTSEAALHTLVQQTFPTWGDQTASRLEALGAYLASAWPAGGGALRSRGINVSDALHARLLQGAQHVAKTRTDGTTFLIHLRTGIADDGQFVRVVHGLATIYARFQAGRSQSTVEVSASSKIEVSGFEVYELVGKGNMGRVFKAKQKSLDRVVALKVLDTTLAEDDPTFTDRFTSEAKAVAQLQHPNIVGVIDQGTCPHSSVQFIAFEFIDGQTAADMMLGRDEKKLPEREALGICLAVAEALECAEEHGIVHRDVKPDNILIGKDGIPKLADLGLAKRRFERAEDMGLTQSGFIIGTPHYMAPEQALGIDSVDTRADLYALGICLWQFLIGTLPYTSTTPLGVITQHINSDVPDPRSVDPGLSPQIAELLLGLTKRDPEDRYPSAGAAVVDIERVLSGEQVLGPARAASVQRPRETGGVRIGGSGRFSRVGPEGAGASVPIELDAPEGLSPEEAALWRYARTGHHEELGKAQAIYVEMSERAGDVVSAARGMAGLGRLQLLAGDSSKAETAAKAALQADPGCAEAIVVLADAERGLAEASRFAAAMSQLSSLVIAGRPEEARSLANRVRRDFPSEPHPHLVTAVASFEQGDAAGFQESLQLAWALYPSKSNARQILGPGFDLRCVKIFVDFGWEALGSREVERVSLTVENVDDKSNLVAGALRMAIGTGHAALADGDPSEREVRQLLLQIARGVGGLQHFAAAQDLLRQISAVGVPDDEAMTIESAMRQVAGYQGVKQPGIKPKRGRYYCSVGEQLHASVRERMKVIQTRCSANDDEVASICVRMAEIAQDDRIRQEVQQAAQALGVADPYAALDAMRREREEIEAELAEIAESGDAPEAEPEKKTGWMAKLRGAAGKAGRAARHGQLKIKETALRARHGSEVKALGSRIVREIAHFQYAHPEVGALTRRARRRLVTNRVLRAEQEHLKAVQTWIKR